MAVPGFGTAKYGSDRKGYAKTLPDGDYVGRIVPPILSCAESGEWAVGHAGHFGYPTPYANDPSKETSNVFYCVEKVQWVQGEKVTTQECPECVLITFRLGEKEDLVKSLEKEKASDEAIAKRCAPWNKFLKTHNKDFKYYINFKTPDGAFETRKVPSKVKKQLDDLLAQYRKARLPWDGIDPEQGLWFRISKSGKGLKTEYKVSVEMDEREVDGQVYQVYRKAPLTAQDAVNAAAKCLDLHEVGIIDLPVEKVQALVDSNGVPDVVTAILKSARPARAASVADEPAHEAAHEAPPGHATPPVMSAPPAPAATQQQPKPPPTPSVPPRAQSKSEAEPSTAELVAKAKALLAQAKTAQAAKQPKPLSETSEAPPKPPPAQAPAPAALTPKPTPAETPAPVEEQPQASEEQAPDFLSQDEAAFMAGFETATK